MSGKLQIRRGIEVALPPLSEGEPGFTVDTSKLYIGGSNGDTNVFIGPGVSTASGTDGYDGYISFFTGTNEIGGDNDLFWDRPNNRLGIGTSAPVEKVDVAAAIKVGASDTGANNAGAIQWNGANFQGNDGTGWVDLDSGGSPGGADAQIQYNNGGVFGGAAQLYWDDGNNRLGLGTGTPGDILHVVKTQNIGTRLKVENSSTGDSAYASIELDVDVGGAFFRAYGSGNTSTVGGITMGNNALFGSGGAIQGGLNIATQHSVAPIRFMTANTLVGKIDAQGHFGLGNQDPHERLTVNGIVSLEEQDNYDRTHDGYGSLWAKSDGKLYYTNDLGTEYDLTAGASDERLKNSIETVEDALTKTTSLRGVTFEWNESKKGEGTQLGLIAQEVEEIVPELVWEDKLGYKNIKHHQLTGLFVEAIKELRKENEELRQRLSVLENKLNT